MLSVLNDNRYSNLMDGRSDLLSVRGLIAVDIFCQRVLLGQDAPNERLIQNVDIVEPQSLRGPWSEDIQRQGLYRSELNRLLDVYWGIHSIPESFFRPTKVHWEYFSVFFGWFRSHISSPGLTNQREAFRSHILFAAFDLGTPATCLAFEER